MRRTRLIQGLKQLRWKLTLSYMLVTIVVTLVVGLPLGAISDYYHYCSVYQPHVIADKTAEKSSQVAAHFASSPLNTAALMVWLKNLNGEFQNLGGEHGSYLSVGVSYFSDPQVSAVVTDAEGMVLASASEHLTHEVTPRLAHFPASLPSSQAALIKSALRGETETGRLSVAEADGRLIAAAPIFNDDRRVLGALFVRMDAPFNWRVYALRSGTDTINAIGIIVVLSGIVGVCYGFVTARHLTTRLASINHAANAWSRGDFSATADDLSADELGQIARRLNLMAKELQDVLVLRQKLATLEERNRLARDLHDTIKQQVFALTMQIAAARAHTRRNGEVAETHLVEAEKLAMQAQAELLTIIRELRPADGNKKGLTESLRDHVTDWSRRNNITAEMRGDGNESLSAPSAHALLRIAQEALANVARHSHATKILVELEREPEGIIVLSVTDDGDGFEINFDAGGIGLQTMRERAEALPGGWFGVESRIGQGTRVEVGCRVDERNMEG